MLQTTRAERLQPRDLLVHVVRLDVEVHATVVLDALHLDVQIPLCAVEQRILVAFVADVRHSERLAPEARSAVDIGVLAIDQEGRKPAAMHAETVRDLLLKMTT